MTKIPLLLLLPPLLSHAPAGAQGMRFHDRTGEAGLAYQLAEGTAGAAVGDFDGDGWLDVLISGGSKLRPQLFRNNGAAIRAGAQMRWFTNVTKDVMAHDAHRATVTYFADFDNDGDLDLVSVRRFPTASMPEGDPVVTGLVFYEFHGGRYRLLDSDPSLGHDERRHGGMALCDVDCDGDLDVVFVHNGGEGTVGGPGYYIRNDGMPRFVDATASFGADLGTERRYWSAVMCDFNGDMQPDLHCAVDFFSDWHCWNGGCGNFTDVTNQVHATNWGADMGLAVGDIENDGDMDIYSTNIGVGVLYVNDGGGVFTNEASARGVGGWGFETRIGWGTVFSDLDLDGDQDLVFVANGEPGFLYENDGTGHFTNVTEGSWLRLRGHGLIDFDYDKDGDIDLLVFRPGAQYPALFENITPAAEDRHWLVVTLEGTTSNREGVGAKVEALTGSLTQTRMILSGYSFNAQGPRQAHFGLGDARQVDTLRITWPSGTVQTLTDVAADQYLHVVEP